MGVSGSGQSSHENPGLSVLVGTLEPGLSSSTVFAI